MKNASALKKYQFQPGQSGNPAGRPVGARQRFGEAFMRDAMDVWQRYGKIALEKMAQKNPDDYVKAMVVALPKHSIHESINDGTEGMSTDDLRELIDHVREELRVKKAKTIEGHNEANGMQRGLNIQSPTGDRPPNVSLIEGSAT